MGAATFSDSRQEGSAGIDVQRIQAVHADLCMRAFTPGERRQIAGRFGAEDDPAGMLLFWALKEAAIKARRVAWGRPLREIEARLTGEGRATVRMTGEPVMTAAYEQTDEWWLARVVRPPG
jgi:phosphopantetheinyl transferase (holo-ACP synthase)